MTRAGIAWGFALIVGSFACSGDRSAARGEATKQEVAVDGAAVPGDEREFLEALAPLPGAAVRIVYDVDGPGTLDGTLEVMARAGGFRRENWVLSHPGSDGAPNELRGSTIQTPRMLWSALDGEPGIKTRSPLHEIATAYLALEPAARAAATENLRRWHADLRKARTDHPGDVRELAGTACLQMRVAAQELCLWEETGLPLEYRGAEFSVVATRVELDAEISPDAFALPEAAAGAREVEAPAALEIDPVAGMGALVEGNFGPLSSVLTPGLRLPLPDDESW